MHTCTLALLGLAASAVQCVQATLSPLDSGKHSPLALDVLAFHKNLTQIESITGNEADVGHWLADTLEAQGYNVEKQWVQKHPDRFNVYAWKGEHRHAPKVLVSSHIDTVPPFYPYKHDHDTHVISGRGSVDAKGSVATQVIAVNRLLSRGAIKDDIGLLYVVGEETGGDGMQHANDLHLKPQSVIFGEPTEGKLVSGHKGILWMKLTAKGKAAHSGYPWLGRSANEVLTSSLAALMELGAHLPRSDKYGVTTINLGKLTGGVAANVVAQDAEAEIAIRIASGTPEFLRDEVTKAVHLAVQPYLAEGKLEPTDVVTLEFSAGYAPVALDADVPGFEVITVNYGTDVPNFNQTVDGQKRYLYGPGTIFVAHSDHEALTEDELWDAVHGYERIILHAFGKDVGDDDENKSDL
nr:putative carboxypeptidase [Quercus suber]